MPDIFDEIDPSEIEQAPMPSAPSPAGAVQMGLTQIRTPMGPLPVVSGPQGAGVAVAAAPAPAPAPSPSPAPAPVRDIFDEAADEVVATDLAPRLKALDTRMESLRSRRRGIGPQHPKEWRAAQIAELSKGMDETRAERDKLVLDNRTFLKSAGREDEIRPVLARKSMEAMLSQARLLALEGVAQDQQAVGRMRMENEQVDPEADKLAGSAAPMLWAQTKQNITAQDRKLWGRAKEYLAGSLRGEDLRDVASLPEADRKKFLGFVFEQTVPATERTYMGKVSENALRGTQSMADNLEGYFSEMQAGWSKGRADLHSQLMGLRKQITEQGGKPGDVRTGWSIMRPGEDPAVQQLRKKHQVVESAIAGFDQDIAATERMKRDARQMVAAGDPLNAESWYGQGLIDVAGQVPNWLMSAAIGAIPAVGPAASVAWWVPQIMTPKLDNLRAKGFKVGNTELALAFLSSIPEAAIEHMQVGGATGAFGKIGGAARQGALTAARQAAQAWLVETAKSWAGEMTEEVLQALNDKVFLAVAGALQAEAPEIDWAQELAEFKGDMGRTAVSMAYMILPGSMGGGVRGAGAAVQQRAAVNAQEQAVGAQVRDFLDSQPQYEGLADAERLGKSEAAAILGVARNDPAIESAAQRARIHEHLKAEVQAREILAAEKPSAEPVATQEPVKPADEPQAPPDQQVAPTPTEPQGTAKPSMTEAEAGDLAKAASESDLTEMPTPALGKLAKELGVYEQARGNKPLPARADLIRAVGEAQRAQPGVTIEMPAQQPGVTIELPTERQAPPPETAPGAAPTVEQPKPPSAPAAAAAPAAPVFPGEAELGKSRYLASPEHKRVVTALLDRYAPEEAEQKARELFQFREREPDAATGLIDATGKRKGMREEFVTAAQTYIESGGKEPAARVMRTGGDEWDAVVTRGGRAWAISMDVHNQGSINARMGGEAKADREILKPWATIIREELEKGDDIEAAVKRARQRIAEDSWARGWAEIPHEKPEKYPEIDPLTLRGAGVIFGVEEITPGQDPKQVTDRAAAKRLLAKGEGVYDGLQGRPGTTGTRAHVGSAVVRGKEGPGVEDRGTGRDIGRAGPGVQAEAPAEPAAAEAVVASPAPQTKLRSMDYDALATESYRKDEVPDGWYVHGRGGHQQLGEYVTQLTRNWNVAEQYGRNGSMWLIRPRTGAKVLDADDVALVDAVWKKLNADYDAGRIVGAELERLVRDYREHDDGGRAAFQEEVSPKNIVGSAELYDMNDFAYWLYDSMGYQFVRGQSGSRNAWGVVLDKEGIDAGRVRQGPPTTPPPAPVKPPKSPAPVQPTAAPAAEAVEPAQPAAPPRAETVTPPPAPAAEAAPESVTRAVETEAARPAYTELVSDLSAAVLDRSFDAKAYVDRHGDKQLVADTAAFITDANKRGNMRMGSESLRKVQAVAKEAAAQIVKSAPSAKPSFPPPTAAQRAEAKADTFMARLRSDVERLKSQPKLTAENQQRYQQEIAPLEEQAKALREKISKAKQKFQSTKAEAEHADITHRMNAVYERLLADQKAEAEKPAPAASLRTAAEFRARAVAAGFEPDHVDGMLAVMAARAKLRGEDADQYIASRIADVVKGGIVPKGALPQTHNVPQGIIAQYKASSWRTAGFVLPDGTLLGQVGRHKEIPALMGYGSGSQASTDPAIERWMRDYGVVRATRFHSQTGIQSTTIPTWAQAEQLAVAADGLPTTLEAYDPEAKRLAYEQIDSPDAEAIIRFFSRSFDPENPNILMQAEQRDLVALHNLSAENLLHAAKLGGLAAPSLAIKRTGQEFGGFGEITLIGNKEMVTPGGSTKVFGSDVYAPRYPEVRSEMSRADQSKLEAFYAKVYERYPKARGRITIDPAQYDVLRVQDEAETRDFSRALEMSLGSQLAYMEEVGKAKPEWKNLDRDALESEIRGEVWSNPEGKPTFSDWARALPARLGLNPKEQIYTGTTYTGRRRYIAHTLENVVRMLKKDIRSGEGFSYGTGNVRALVTPQFRTLGAVRRERGKIVNREQFEALREETTKELVAIATDAQPYMKAKRGFGDLDAFVEHLSEIVETHNAGKVWTDYYDDLPAEVRNRAYEFLNKLRSMPTEYFEAKLLRGVGLNEFAHAVIPKTASQEVRDALATRGVKVTEYDKSIPGDRGAKVAEVSERENLLFQRNKGAVSFADGRAVVHALESADVSTLVHEVGHIFRRDMTPAETAVAEKTFGVTDGKWTREAEERFARSFEKYMQGGLPPFSGLRGVFQKFKTWLTEVYGALRGKLAAEERAFWDSFLGKPAVPAEAAPAEQAPAAESPAPRPARIEEAKREVEAAMDAAGVPKGGAEAEPPAETQPVSARDRFVSTREMMHIRKGFHRGSQQEAIEAAAKSSAESNAPRYVYATAAGAQVVNEVPVLPPGQAYLEVTATPTKGGHNVTIERREGGTPLTTAPEGATVEEEEPSGPEAAPQDRLEPAAQDAGGDGPAGVGTAGKDTTVHFSGLPDLATRYAVVEAEALIPSHVPGVGPFKKRDDYLITNPRDYSDLNLAAKVHEHAAAKQADWFLAESPDSTNGPPIVTADGTVLSGNGRAMTLQLSAKRGKYDWYKDALVAKAPAVGIDAEAVQGMKHPVLVRMSIEALTPDEMEKYASSGNVGATYEMSSVRENAQLGDLIDDSLLETVRLGLKENSNQSVGQILAGADGLRFRRELRRRLSQDFPQKLARFFEGDGDTLSDAGKVQTRDLLFTKVFAPETIERMSPDWKDKLEGSIPQLLKFNRDYPEKTPVPQIAEAVEFRRGWKKSGQTLRDYLDQSFMFGQTPPQISPAARMMLEFFDENGIRKVRAGLTDFLRELSTGAGLFASQETRTTGQIAAETLGVESRKGADFGLGANNTFFTKQKIEDIRKQRKKRGPTMGSVLGGIDPLLLKQAFYEGGYWVEAGLRQFKSWLSTMRQKYGGLGLSDEHLKQLWQDLAGFRRRVGLWERQVAGAERRGTVKGERTARRAAVELGRAGVRTIEATKAAGVRDLVDVGRAAQATIDKTAAAGAQAVERTAAAAEKQRVADVVSIGKAAARQMQREGRQTEKKATAEIKATAKFVARQTRLLKRASDLEIAEYAKERLGKQDADRAVALLPRLARNKATLEARAELIDWINRVADARAKQRAVKQVKTALAGLRRDLTPETRAALGDIAGTFSLTQPKAATLRAAEALLAAAEAAQVRGPIMDILPERIARARKLLAGADKPLLRDMELEDIQEIASTLRLLAEANSQQVADHMAKLAAAAQEDIAWSQQNNKQVFEKAKYEIETGKRGELPHMGALHKFVSVMARMDFPEMLQWLFGTNSRTWRVLTHDLFMAQERAQGIMTRGDDAIEAVLKAQGWGINERRRRSEALDVRAHWMKSTTPFRKSLTQTVTLELPSAMAGENEKVKPKRLAKLELTSGERIDLLGKFMDPRVREAIQSGTGLRFEGRRLSGVVYLTVDDMNVIWESAPADEHAIAEAMLAEHATNGKLIEETNIARQGTTAEMSPLNWPIRRAREEFETDPNEGIKNWQSDNVMPKHAGTLKARTGGQISIVVEDAFAGFAHHTAQIAAYVAKQQAMERIIRILDNQDVRKQVGDRVRFGLQALGLIRETIQRFSGYAKSDKYAAETLLRSLLRGVQIASLGFKTHVILGQAVSANKLQLVFGAGDFAAGLAKSAADLGNHAKELIGKGYSPMLLVRTQGKTTLDLLSPGTQSRAVGFRFGDPGNFLSRASSWLLQGSDNKVTWAAVEMGFSEGQRLGLTGEDLDTYAVQRAAEAIRETQATADPLTISPLLQEARERPALKLINGLIFAAERNKTTNILIREGLRYRDSAHTAKGKARLVRAASVVFMDGVLYRGVKYLTGRGILSLAGLVALVFTGRRPPDEDERKRRLAQQFRRGVAQDVLGLYPVVGDVAGEVLESTYRIANGEPAEIRPTDNPVSQVLEDAGRGTADLIRALAADEGETFQSGPDEGKSKRAVLAQRGAMRLGGATAAVAGLPWPAVRQLGRPVVQAVESARPMGQFNEAAKQSRQALRELEKARDAEIRSTQPDIEPEQLAKERKSRPVDLGIEARARTMKAVEDIIDRLTKAAKSDPAMTRYADAAALVGAGLPLRAGEPNPFAPDAPEAVKRIVGRTAAGRAKELTSALPVARSRVETLEHYKANRASRTRDAEVARDFFSRTGLTLEQAVKAIELAPLSETETLKERNVMLARFRAAWRLLAM
ncbi:MAG: hypothetical protein WC789_09230 [Lentisphaeria bacterium]